MKHCLVIWVAGLGRKADAMRKRPRFDAFEELAEGVFIIRVRNVSIVVN
jgi:hypothetical protein